MLNEEKIRLMTKLAMFEEKEGKRALPINKYYRSDYLGIALIKNFFLTSIAYLLVLLVFGGASFNYLLDNIHKMNIVTLGTMLILGYIILLAIYTIITYIYYTIEYRWSQKSVKVYDHNLKILLGMYKEDVSESEDYTSEEEV